MIVLALTCVFICAVLIALAAIWQRVRSSPPQLAQETSLYAGFMADVDRRLAAGDIDADQAREERAEAGRALLKASDRAETTGNMKPLHGYIALGLVAVASAWLYLFIGHPKLADQPYKQRLATWTRLAQSQPDSLPPKAMAAVLRQGEHDHAKEVDYWLFLGRIDMLAGNNYQGAQDYQKARELAPQTFTAWSELGEALTFVGGGVSGPDAKAAFQNALKLNAKDPRAHYYLGQQAISDGDYETARSHLTAALSAMAPNDVSRRQVQDALDSIAPAEAAAQAMSARISGMVAGLEGQLQANPENPDGWARLLRSYDVLGDRQKRAAAQAAMQSHYAKRPDVIADILTRAQTRVGSEGEAK
ncbi:c-type cytochrome biogenesis protein CcmI [Asticcacaulis sp. 201]|uniref:c-type cytochrome biogenesis protein CcmI n=1 Tax=Asticcacaulis sp. 201 TaxID=3028787 RepID=UPI0029166C30|nr:c-type cytochrome biogenesis protein CcmI [Asticcacaulis sp. 201]MDV6331913.1 c-type cytochrome biogenesis protein CcmI [Asticcacaulis sp. 201]